MALENWTTWTETDANSKLTVAANTLTVTAGTFNDSFSVGKDYGASHFGNFNHEFQIKTTTRGSGSNARVYWMMGNDTLQQRYGTHNGILIYGWADSGSLYLEETGGSYQSASYSNNTDYWLRIERTGGTALSCKIYSDSGRTNLLSTLSITVANTAYRYLTMANVGYGDTAADSFVIKDLNINEAASVPIVVINQRNMRPRHL